MKLTKIDKKGDLSLSINAIVILILAITMLGLGLAFLRGTFSKTTAQFSEVADTVKEQIVDKIKSSNEKVAFDRLEIELKRSESKDLFYGIRNVLESTAGTDTFYIRPFCDQAIKPLTTDFDVVDFGTFDSWDVTQGEIEVLKLTVSAKPGAALDTYSCKINICTADPGANDNCPTPISQYAVKKFFVVVK